MKVKFYDAVKDDTVRFVVIVALHQRKWVFCKHRERTTFEFAGGHRECGETLDEAARRELFEETGAIEFKLSPVCFYSVTGKTRVNETGEETFGRLYYAEIVRFGALPPFEMEQVSLFSDMPTELTYPHIQPYLMERIFQLGYGMNQNIPR